MSAMGKMFYEMQEYAENLIDEKSSIDARAAFIERYPSNGFVFDDLLSEYLGLSEVHNDPY